jgi:hypothetical protein
MNMQLPRGRIPDHVMAFMRQYPEVPAFMLVCSCGHWFTEIDRLAPYHWENCRCKACGDGYTKGTK